MSVHNYHSIVYISALIAAFCLAGCSDKAEETVSVPDVAAQRKACLENMSQIEAAFAQAAMSGIENPTAKDIYGEDKYIKTPLKCPATGAEYIFLGNGAKTAICPNPSAHKR